MECSLKVHTIHVRCPDIHSDDTPLRNMHRKLAFGRLVAFKLDIGEAAVER